MINISRLIPFLAPAGWLALSALAQPVVLLQENFSSGALTTQALPHSAEWFGSGNNLSIVESASATSALRNSVPQRSTAVATFYFAATETPVTLSRQGDRISLRFNLTPLDELSNPAGLRIGLLESGKTRLTNNKDPELALSGGYGIVVNATTQSLRLYQRTTEPGRVFSNLRSWKQLFSIWPPQPPLSLHKGETYNILFELERSADAIDAVYVLSKGSERLAIQRVRSTQTPLHYAFDTAAIGLTSNFGNADISSVTVTYTPATAESKANRIQTFDLGNSERRASVLMLSHRVTAADAQALQETLSDSATIDYIVGPAQDATGALAQLKALENYPQNEVVYLELKPEAVTDANSSAYRNTLEALAEALAQKAHVVLWAQSPDDPNNTLIREVMTRHGIIIAEYSQILPEANDRAMPVCPLQSPLSAQSLTEVLRAGLLAGSSPWAQLPSDSADPALLADAQTAKQLLSPQDLPRVNVDITPVYTAQQGEWQFNMHPFIAWYDNQFWIIFSTGRVDEDSSSQFVRYTTSADGRNWSEIKTLVADPDGEDGPLQWMPGGLQAREDGLYAYATLHTGHHAAGLPVWQEAKLHRFKWSGAQWVDEGEIAEDSLIYFPPMRIGDNDFIVRRDGHAGIHTALAPADTNDWVSQELPGYMLPRYRMSETSHYVDPQGVAHLIIRDQGRTRLLQHSVSYDGGATWTVPVLTNYPDGISKNLSGSLSNGLYYLINTPVERANLTISTSSDGWTFTNPRLLRTDMPAMRYPGRWKNSNSANYSHAVEHDGRLWLVHAVNKEDIEIISFAIDELAP